MPKEMKVIVYIGPTLDINTARSILPEAIFLPPIRHCDLISDINIHNPSHVIIIDGDFSGHLPVWHKECVYCCLKGIKLYGASSMGALRASELQDVGVMTGVGSIFNWYWEGVIESDDEVAVVYHTTPSGEYITDTCPLVNIRAGLINQLKLGLLTNSEAEAEFNLQKSLHYASRINTPSYSLDQKRMDAIQLLTTFTSIDINPCLASAEWISPIFRSALERERRVKYNGALVTMQHIDSYISLHSQVHDQILWDSKNRALCLMFADYLAIIVSEEEIENEWSMFCSRNGLLTWEFLETWLESNALNHSDFYIMMIQNARIRKLQRAYCSTNNWSRQTQTVLDYLRTHYGIREYMDKCSDCESTIVNLRNDDSTFIDCSVPLEKLLSDHMKSTGFEIHGSLDNFLRESGISTKDELRICLERYALARRNNK